MNTVGLNYMTLGFRRLPDTEAVLPNDHVLVVTVIDVDWEQKRDDSTRMSWPTEKDIRLFAFRQLNPRFKAFMELYEGLRRVQDGGQECIRVSLADSKGVSGAAGRPRLVRIGGARKAVARRIS